MLHAFCFFTRFVFSRVLFFHRVWVVTLSFVRQNLKKKKKKKKTGLWEFRSCNGQTLSQVRRLQRGRLSRPVIEKVFFEPANANRVFVVLRSFRPPEDKSSCSVSSRLTIAWRIEQPVCCMGDDSWAHGCVLRRSNGLRQGSVGARFYGMRGSALLAS